ncbi:unnamed protein product [Paramecium sonneborni]|uniref:Uncharacterized protein n=1 Tax=Paramecium sonneborni TaxID=65129 RepID=A0A8S1KWZ9_9CILI|nr:unnamed protein product [Paramecium sonneborni]
MGNQCASQEKQTSEAPIARASLSRLSVQEKLIKDNNAFINSCTETYFIKFHKKIIENDIQELYKNMYPKKMFIKIKGKYPDDAEQQIIYKKISYDMQQKEKHLYNQLILHYSQFLNELFDLDEQPPLKSITSYNYGDVKTSTQLVRNVCFKRSFSENFGVQQRSIPDKKITQLSINNQNITRQFFENKQLAQLILEQLSCMFKLWSTIIEYTYGSFISSVFGNDIEAFTDRQLFICKIYQKDLFKSIPQISIILSNALPIVYNNKSALISNDCTSPSNLDSSLMPQMNENIQSENFFDLLDSIEQKIEEQQKYYENNWNALPYSQTFGIIDGIINCKMPWMKFKLIGKLDQLIVEIFLSSRSNNQLSHFKNIIQPEDAKIEVLKYILQKYMCSSQNQNLLLCYYYLRWMQEYDSVIHQKLKTFTCPYFIRFLSLYEVAYNYYSRKQAMLLFNQ